MLKLFAIIGALALYITEILGHGMIHEPSGRSSRWHTNSTAPRNDNDNELFCGGFAKQTNVNGGKCGLCGDDWSLPAPRPNELGGKPYGEGVIVKTFNAQKATVVAKITANHLGYIFYELCNLDESKGVESEECFQKNRLKFADGKDRYDVGKRTGLIETDIVFPTAFKCKHCVLRWTYFTGNNWGICENGTGATGCGPQETFKSCADVSLE